MEYKVVEVKVPKGMVPDNVELVILESQEHKLEGDVELGIISQPGLATSDGAVCLLVERHKISKPDWQPPKMKKGWLTWDASEWWWWWPVEPQHDEKWGWSYPKTGGDGREEIRIGEIADLLGFPDCTEFDERNCIWEVGK